MPFGNLGMGEVILILVVLLLVFGARRLPEIGAALGKGIREFKGSIKEIETDINRSQMNSGQQPRQDAFPNQNAQQSQQQQAPPPQQATQHREQAPPPPPPPQQQPDEERKGDDVS